MTPQEIDDYKRVWRMGSYFQHHTHSDLRYECIEWCKENFRIGENDIYFVDEKNECIELILMTFFTHNILANSTFSWWGSYLSNCKNKTVIAPSQWFQKDGPSEWKEIYYPNWIVV